MTRTDHVIPNQPEAVAGRIIELRWTSVQSAWSQPLVECDHEERLNCRAEIVLSLHFVDHGHALIEVWLHASRSDKRAKRLLKRRPATCVVTQADGMLHVDASLDGRRALALSIDDEADRLSYAQCPLLADLGFPGGTYHPPTWRRVEAERSVASA
jgi:hypothetical protein